MSCKSIDDKTYTHVSGVAKVGLCPKFRKKWDLLENKVEKNKFLENIGGKIVYMNEDGKIAFKVNYRFSFLDLDTKISDPVLTEKLKDVATIFVSAEYNPSDPEFADVEYEEDAIKTIFYGRFFDDLEYVCSLRQIKPLSLGLVVSKKEKKRVEH